MSSSTLALVVRHPKLKALYGLWLRLCAGGSFPALDGMSPADLRPWLDNMAILGLDETGGYVYRYYSPAYASAFGGDLTGCTLARIAADRAAVLAAEYDAVRADRLPVSRVYTAIFDGEQQTWERLVLPFFDLDGEVSKLLVAAYRVDA